MIELRMSASSGLTTSSRSSSVFEGAICNNGMTRPYSGIRPALKDMGDAAITGVITSFARCRGLLCRAGLTGRVEG
jgi:hypothetical protein